MTCYHIHSFIIYLHIFSVEGVESAIKLVDEILSREGFPAALVEGQVPLPSVVAAIPAVDVVEEERPEKRGAKSLPGAPPSLLQKASNSNLSKSALKRLRRKHSQETGDDEEDQGEAEESGEDENEEETLSVPAPVTTQSTAVVPSVSVPATPAFVAAPVAAPSVAPSALPASKVGVIGKSSPRAADAPTVFDFPPQPASAFVLNPADQHHYHQQHLINLLLGDSPAPSADLRTLAPASSQSGYNSLQIPTYQPPAQNYSSHYNSANFSTQPSALYASSAPSGAIGSGAGRVGSLAPPGIVRPAASLSVQTAAPPSGLTFPAPQRSPVPPGLSPIGAGVATSRFSFGDFNSPSSASLNVPALPQYQYPAPSLYTYPPASSAPSTATQSAAAPAANYYKSKSGFSVRL